MDYLQHTEQDLPRHPGVFEEAVRSRYPSFLFVDRSPVLREILGGGANVRLITAPDGFGKTLCLDMIRQFVSIGADPALFYGLKITEDPAFCGEHQGKYPVLWLDLSAAQGLSLPDACETLTRQIIRDMNGILSFLRSSEALNEEEREICRRYAGRPEHSENGGESGKNGENRDSWSFSPRKISSWPADMTQFLRKHFGRDVVVLLDGFDALLNRFFGEAWHREALNLTRSLLTGLLCGNDALAFAVLTGSTRIAWESVFSAGTRPSVWTPPGESCAGLLAFRSTEVRDMLERCGVPETFDQVTEWYGGYRSGEESLYCPGDVVSYAVRCLEEHAAVEPTPCRAGSSCDPILDPLLSRTAESMRGDYLDLLDGRSVWKPVSRELTFEDLEEADAIWTVWAAGGFLTIPALPDSPSDTEYELTLPNRSAQERMKRKLHGLIRTEPPDFEEAQSMLLSCLLQGDAEGARFSLSSLIRNGFPRPGRGGPEHVLETFTGALSGILLWNSPCHVGAVRCQDGRGSIRFEDRAGTGVVLVLGYGTHRNLNTDARTLLDQIRDDTYENDAIFRQCRKVHLYAIACTKTAAAVQVHTVRK